MYERNYTELVLTQNYSIPPPGTRLVPCIHGWEFDYTKYATTVVTEVSEYLFLLQTSMIISH
ncbi:hypothetical protein O3M35_011099 [Rhynocoris fuscipes]|uniref:Uncharacterized protein n=1 Tax=Rhynocoris fuscipes TaxID=488301 RepID=A0AAW1CV36_9HEMI